MKYKYERYEIHYASEAPTEEGKYFGSTPIFEQALNAAKAIKGSLYGITEEGVRVYIDFDIK